jgi:hypothetical protein
MDESLEGCRDRRRFAARRRVKPYEHVNGITAGVPVVLRNRRRRHKLNSDGTDLARLQRDWARVGFLRLAQALRGVEDIPVENK